MSEIVPTDQVAWYQYGVAATKIVGEAQALVKPAYDAINVFTVAGPERDEAIAKKDAIEKDYKDKRDKAIQILASAVALPDANIAKAARITLESLWKPAHNETLEGLDDLIKEKKTALGVK